MQLEAAQLLSTALWVDDTIGAVPRALEQEELRAVKERCKAEPDIEERQFLRYLACHHNHPCAIWVRESTENFYWTINYVNALNSETVWRGNKSHASCAEVNRMPMPKHIPCEGLTPFARAMPPELVSDDVIEDYRLFYMLDKAAIPATWKVRGTPAWWDENIALRHKRYTDMTVAERKETGWLS